MDDLFDAAAKKDDAHQIKTDPYKTGGPRKIVELFQFRHYLGDTHEYGQAYQRQGNAPYQLVFVFTS